MPVFQINKNHTVVLNPEAAKLVPELKSLKEAELWYVILVADYVDGPFRKKPYDERVQMALKKIWGGKRNPPTSYKILNAIEAYKSLVFDIRRETVDIYKRKVAILQKETLKEDLALNSLKQIDQTIRFLSDRIESIERDLDTEEDENIELKGQRQLSYLEKWQRNQKEYSKFNDD